MPDLNSWTTGITRIADGVIEYRGKPIEDVMSRYSFEEVLWLLLVGEEANPSQQTALRYALIAAADHGPGAPSVAAARIAASTRGNLVSSVAVGLISFGGQAHGAAAEEVAHLYGLVAHSARRNGALAQAVEESCGPILKAGRRIPGYGHPYHSQDPRVELLMRVAPDVREHREVAKAVESFLAERLGKTLAVNADGAVAALLLDVGLAPEQVCLVTAIGRSAGLAAHVWEEHQNEAPFRAPAMNTIHYVEPKGVGDR